MIHLRKCKRSDFKELLKLEHLSFKQPYTFTTFEYFLYTSPEGFIIAEDEGELIGYVIFITVRGCGIIVSLAVHPDMRRRNYGTFLLQYALRKLKKKVSKVNLQVRATNQVAITFYRRNRFISESIIEGYYLDGEDAIVMKRFI
jgi:ribosomal-protein-alanine N-acetyltransferase